MKKKNDRRKNVNKKKNICKIMVTEKFGLINIFENAALFSNETGNLTV